MSCNSSDCEAELIAEDLDTLDLGIEELQYQADILRQKPNVYLRKPRFNLDKMPNETQNLTQSLSHLNLSQNQGEGSSTNSSDIPRNEIQLLLQAIPEYFPGQNLSIFINEVDNLTQHLNKRLTADLVYVVNFTIRSKIKGDAREYISHQNATEWHEIRAALLQKYGDQRSEDLLTSSLTQCVQLRNESYMDYYGRLLKAFNDLMQYVSLHETDQNYLAFKKIEYERLALKTFQIGLLEPHRSYLSNFELKTVEDCLNKCHFYDNRKQEWDYCEFIRKTQSMSFESKKFQPKQTTQNATRNFPNQNQNPQNNPFQRRNFQNPSQNPENPQGFKYNINTKLPTPQRLHTNARKQATFQHFQNIF